MKYFLRFSLNIFILIVYKFLNLFAFKLNSNEPSSFESQTHVNTYYEYTTELTSDLNESNLSLYSNITRIEDFDTTSLIQNILLSIVLIPIILATLIGNLLVIFAVVIVRKLHTQDNANNFLIVSLAVSDFLVGVLVMPFGYYVNISKDNKWHLGAILCDLWTLSDVLLCTASILNLVAISVDRYFIILHAMVYTQKRNAKLMLLMIFIVWSLSALISIPPQFGWGKPSSRLEIYQTCEVSTDLNYQIYATLLAFYLPLIAMIIIYIAIFRAASHIKKREIETSCRTQFKRGPTLTYSSESNANMKLLSEPLINQNNNYDNKKSTDSLVNGLTIKKNSSSTNNNINPFDKRDSKNKKNSKQLVVKSKKSASDSEHGSFESKVYNSSESSENISSMKKNSKSLLSPVSTVVMSNINSNNTGSHVTINAINGSVSRRGSLGKRFGRRLTQAFSGLKRNSAMSSSHGKNQKATRTLGVIMGCFILCWLPFFILALLKPIRVREGLSVGDYIPKWLDSFLLWMGYFNSALNPMIYARFNREFRKPFVEILCFRCRGINDKLRDEERRKMYEYPSQGHSSISHAHYVPSNLYSLPSASVSNIPFSTEINTVKLSGDNEGKRVEIIEPIKEGDTPLLDISICKEHIEKDKNRFFYGTDEPPLNVDDTKEETKLDVNNNEILENSSPKCLTHETLKNSPTDNKILEEGISIHSNYASPLATPAKQNNNLVESISSETEDNIVEPLKNIKYRNNFMNRINSSARSSIITNDSSNYFESTNSILEPIEDCESLLSSSYLRSMDSTSLNSKQSSSLASKNIASSILNKKIINDKFVDNSINDSIEVSIPSSSIYSFYSSQITSPGNIVLASNENTTIYDSSSNATNPICENSIKSETSRQRKLLNNSNSTADSNCKLNKSVPLAYCTFNRQRRSSQSKILTDSNNNLNNNNNNNNTKLIIRPSIPDTFPMNQDENDNDVKLKNNNNLCIQKEVTSSV